MRSVDETSLSSSGDATADRIVDVTCRLIAESGVDSTSVRAVARSAGVSAPLVIHHFGSKAGLVAACDAKVCEAVDAALGVLCIDGEPSDLAASWIDLLSSTPYLGYITQSLRDGGTAGTHLFDLLYQVSADVDQSMRDEGLAKPTSDPEMRALLLMALDMGMLLLSEHVERILGGPLESPEIGQRWVAGVVELLTDGVLTGSDPDSPPEESL